MGSEYSSKPLPGGPPDVTALKTPEAPGALSDERSWVGRDLTPAEVAASRRAEAGKTWSPSTRPVPVVDKSLKFPVTDKSRG